MLRHEQAAVAQALAEREAEFAASVQERDVLRHEQAAVAQALAEREAEFAASVQERDVLRRERAGMAQALAEQEAARQQLTRDLAASDASRQRIRREFEERKGKQRADTVALAALADQHAARLAATASERNQLGLRFKKLDRRLRKLKKSPSWRLTRWVRLLAGALRTKSKKSGKTRTGPPATLPMASSATRPEAEIAAHDAVVRQSGLLLPSWYARRHVDVDVTQVDPIEHYLQHASKLLLSPCPFFDSEWYRLKYPDVKKKGLDPFIHFLTTGWQEDRLPHPLFDPKIYLRNNPDLSTNENPLAHYIRRGASEGRVAFTREVFASEDAQVALGRHITDAAKLTTVAEVRRLSGVAIYVNGHGNYFFHQIAEILCAGLRELDVRVSLNSEGDLDPDADIHVVVAPHEFLILGSNRGAGSARPASNPSCIAPSNGRPPGLPEASRMPCRRPPSSI